MSALVAESLSVSGIMLGKTMGSAAMTSPTASPRESKEIADLEVRSRMAGRWVMSTIQMTFAIQPAIIYWLAGQSFVGDSISIGTVVAFTTLQTRLLFPIQSLLGVGADMEASLALFDRIFEYLDLPVDIVESRRSGRCSGPTRCWARCGSRTCRSAMAATGAATRRGRSTTSTWSFPAGTRTAVVGETGAGQDDARLPGGAAVRAPAGPGDDRRRRRARRVSLESLAATVGVVSQETYLFHSSVRENLRFAVPDATDEEIEEAARTARIHDLIASLPEGYDTVVGERGYRFSGGEKQRMAIARTILRNPPVLVLDEATSSLDTQTEAAVQAELERLSRGPDDDHDRPPAVDRPRRRPDRGARPRADRRARDARGAARARRAVRRARRAGRRRTGRLGDDPSTASPPGRRGSRRRPRGWWR